MGKTLRTLIARNDESFSFLYQETIDAMGEVTFFDPETEVPHLEDIDLLYLPGGYPEKHLEALVRNEVCRKAIKDFAERGGRILAECGGMMFSVRLSWQTMVSFRCVVYCLIRLRLERQIAGSRWVIAVLCLTAGNIEDMSFITHSSWEKSPRVSHRYIMRKENQ